MKSQNPQTLYDLSIAPRFNELANDLLIDGGKYTHYILKGGRNSTKSSFIALTIILMMGAANEDGTPYMPGCHAVAIRRYAEYLAGSVYNRLLWAIGLLGLDNVWIKHKSPLELIHKPTGNKIIFYGADDTERLKSINSPTGYYRFIWFEEFSEIDCEEDCRKILQSFMRGGDKFTVFYSYNPPKSVNNWVNAYAKAGLRRKDTFVHHSTYRTVPREWIGEPALAEAENLKETKEIAYQHEYLGKETGTGGAIFSNVIQRPITDEEIANFDRQNRGLDFGFTIHPASYHVNYYSKTSDTLFIFFEIYKTGLKNSVLAEMILEENTLNETVKADSAEPKSISEMKDCGLNVVGAHKGKDSVRYGIKWLQDRRAIVIDPARCPNAAREFTGYEHERDKHGNFRADYPDADNHSIDDQRYACEDYIDEERKRRERGNGEVGKGAQGSNITGARSSIVGKRGSRQW